MYTNVISNYVSFTMQNIYKSIKAYHTKLIYSQVSFLKSIELGFLVFFNLCGFDVLSQQITLNLIKP